MLRTFTTLASILLVAGASVALAGPSDQGALAESGGDVIPTTDIPDPSHSFVEPWDAMVGMVANPNGETVLPASRGVIHVRNTANQPLMDGFVVLELLSGTSLCPDVILTGTTDNAGRVEIVLSGGGCMSGVPLAGLIKANGVTIRAYDNVKSPDFDGAEGNLKVDLADLVAFSDEFLFGSGDCHDYDNNGMTNLGDLISFSPAFVGGDTCP